MKRTYSTHYGEVPLPEGIVSRKIQNNNGLEMHILEARPDEKERPLIILAHGFPELAYSWRHILPEIAALGYVVVAPDQRGFGRTVGWSNQYENSIEPFNLVNLARDIVGLVKALGYSEVKAIIGHDAGSYVAGVCALIRPDLFKACVMMSAPFAGVPPMTEKIKSVLARPT
ncbi:MAG TPA: alpha/beta hydrolase, partial [Betaproteobacteria bacterium]|nr:alpha/beta hydrolase [Betaproteobacteria bacterium]